MGSVVDRDVVTRALPPSEKVRNVIPFVAPRILLFSLIRSEIIKRMRIIPTGPLTQWSHDDAG